MMPWHAHRIGWPAELRAFQHSNIAAFRHFRGGEISDTLIVSHALSFLMSEPTTQSHTSTYFAFHLAVGARHGSAQPPSTPHRIVVFHPFSARAENGPYEAERDLVAKIPAGCIPRKKRPGETGSNPAKTTGIEELPECARSS